MSEKKKNPGGRPTKYLPEYCEQLIEYAKRGGSFRGFAGKIGVNEDTCLDWCKRHPEFLGAKNLARELAFAWFEEQGLQGMWAEEKGTKLNTTLWYMNMKNRFGWRDQVRVESTNTNVNSVDPAQMDDLKQVLLDIKKAKGK